ncbi:G-coupled receptor -like protein [Brachionus plicatilis]|uniref:G-coupled receptor-like protein n=1 Tax=Brachionus plicatilis TaxID=10195 RepID=A0A3M7QML5_BRAPC|nr:G-coupled receptor -like protein [Brachionus plicatilis]
MTPILPILHPQIPKSSHLTPFGASRSFENPKNTLIILPYLDYNTKQEKLIMFISYLCFRFYYDSLYSNSLEDHKRNLLENPELIFNYQFVMNELLERFLALSSLKIDLSFLQLNFSTDSDLILSKLDNITLTDDMLDNTNLDKWVEKFYILSKWLNAFIITIITLFGLYGNTMSLLIFFSHSFSKQSFKILRMYLIFLSTSDLFVLIFHYIDFTFLSWTNLIKSRNFSLNLVNQSRAFCKLVPFLRNVFRTTSVYSLIFLSIQRTVSLYFPMIKSRWSNLRFNKILIWLIFALSILLNLNNLVLNDLVSHYKTNQIFCSINRNFLSYQFLFDFKYIIFTILVPIFIIIGISIVLYRKIRFSLKNALKKTESFSVSMSGRSSRSMSLNQIRFGSKKSRNDFAYFGNRINKIRSVRAAYLIVILSKWFVFLHLPYAIIWSILHFHLKEESIRLNFKIFLGRKYQVLENGIMSIFLNIHGGFLEKSVVNMFKIFDVIFLKISLNN